MSCFKFFCSRFKVKFSFTKKWETRKLDVLVEECGETVKHPVAEGHDTLMAEIKEKVRPVDDTLAQDEDEEEEGALASLSAETTSDAATNGSRNDGDDANGTEEKATAEIPVAPTLLTADEDQEAEESLARNIHFNQIQTSQNIKSHSIKNKSLFGAKQYNCRTRCYIITNIALFTSRDVKEQINVSF
jgi:hypothetical protein